MEFTNRTGHKPFPVEGCSGQALMWTAMRVHFWHQHGRDTVVILEEGNLPHPQCPLCGILMPWKALNGTHMRTSQFTRGAERRIRRLAVKEGKEVTDRAFSPSGRPLDMVTYFKYLGPVISENGRRLAGGGEELGPGK